MNSYKTPFGLPVRFSFESGLHIENEFLFGIYELLAILKYKDSYDRRHDEVVVKLHRFYHEAKSKGFPNHIVSSVPEKELSHDQATAYSCYSILNGLDGHLRIYQSIENGKLEGRRLHPRDLIFYGLLNNDLRAYLALPLLYIIFLVTCFNAYKFEIYKGKLLVKKKSSSMMLWFLRLHTSSKKPVLRAFMFPVRLLFKIASKVRYGGENELVTEYFQNDPENPVVQVLINK